MKRRRLSERLVYALGWLLGTLAELAVWFALVAGAVWVFRTGGGF